MSKIKLFLIVLVLFSLLGNIQTSAIVSDYTSDIDITLVNYEPDPINPGRVVELKFQIENNGADKDRDVYLEVLPEYPFSIYSGEEKVYLGKLRSYQSGSDAYIVKYKLRVDDNAIGGVYDIKLKLWEGDFAIVYEEDFQVTVESTGKDLSVDYYFDPVLVTPGSPSELFIKLNNNGIDNYENIYFKLNVSDNFIVLDSTEEKFIERLNRGEEKLITYKFTLSPDYSSPAYLIPLTLEYEDDSGNSFSKELKLTTIVNNYAELLSYVSSSSNFVAGGVGEVTVSFANTGIAKIKALNVEIIDTDDYDILSPKIDYIGDVDADDVESEEFKLYINPDAEGAVDIKLKLNYRDEKNKITSDEVKIPLKIYSGKELKKYQLVASSSGMYIFIAILVIAGLGYFFYRRRKNKKAKGRK